MEKTETLNFLPLTRNGKTPYLLYWILCAAFCGLYFVRDVVGINISYYIIYAMAAAIVLILPKSQIIAFLISIAAFSSAGFNGVFSTMLLICVFIRFFDHLRTVKPYSVLLIIMGLMEVGHFFLVGNVGVGAIITYVTILMVILIIQQYPAEKTDTQLIINSFIVFSVFFVMVTIVRLSITYGSFSTLLQVGFRTEEFSDIRADDGLTGNQNYITSLCSLNLALCALMLSKKMPKLRYIAAALLFALVGLLTVSKMFMVVIAVFVLYVVVMAFKNNALKGIALLTCFAAVAAVVLYFFGDTLIGMVLERFQTGTLTTGRVEILKNLFRYMEEHPITYVFGMGIMQPYYYIGKGVHSSVFEVLGGWGIVGILIVVVYTIGLIRDSRQTALKQQVNITGFNYLPILMLLGYSLVGMLFGSAYSLLKMMVAIYAIQLKEQ